MTDTPTSEERAREVALEVYTEVMRCDFQCDIPGALGVITAALERVRREERAWHPMEDAPKDRWIMLDWGGKAVPAQWLDNSDTQRPWQGWRPPSMWPWPSGKPISWRDFPVSAQAIRSRDEVEE